ncbi:hypothetical protein KYC_02304 [Achromobacter arsenitoxydans SY8]|uniref:DUF3363 domain-containing protein n=1 Tax=Achromobacter arsenitoxydans SY8 TaxID=477184 RepID=H0F129_9BURK|nr:hypothetical protein KYC_02304 [Achromobacter arsenitoxydans SY8]
MRLSRHQQVSWPLTIKAVTKQEKNLHAYRHRLRNLKPKSKIKASDRDGMYVVVARGQAVPCRDPQEVVAAHVRRLEALRRTCIVERVAGICRRSVMLAIGRYAMLDDGMGFSLVPWKPVIEQRLGQQIAATVRGSAVSWEVGRQRGASIWLESI